MRNRSLAARVAAVAAAGGCAVALSGCWQILQATLGGPFPPVHDPDRAVPAAHSSAASGRAFSGRANGRLASRIVLKHGFVKSTIKNARFVGKFTGTLPGAAQPGDELLTPFTNSTWSGQFSVVRDRRNSKIALTGLILADYTNAAAGTPAAGRACLRIAYKNLRKGKRATSTKKGKSTVRILGGEGDAATLVGSATANVRLTASKAGKLRMSGRAKVRRGAARGLNAACKKLERKFGLAPLTR